MVGPRSIRGPRDCITGFPQFWSKKQRSFGSDCIYWPLGKTLLALVGYTREAAEVGKKTLFKGKTPQ
jgi:hypothetical protein